MKTYDELNLLPQKSREAKDALRTAEVEIVNLLMLCTSIAEAKDVNAVKIGHNELAGIRFKISQAMTLIEQAHAVIAECDGDYVNLLTKKRIAVAVEATDLML